MKSELEIQGREATPAEYGELMQALLASQAATPTARACAADAHAARPVRVRGRKCWKIRK